MGGNCCSPKLSPGTGASGTDCSVMATQCSRCKTPMSDESVMRICLVGAFCGFLLLVNKSMITGSKKRLGTAYSAKKGLVTFHSSTEF